MANREYSENNPADNIFSKLNSLDRQQASTETKITNIEKENRAFDLRLDNLAKAHDLKIDNLAKAQRDSSRTSWSVIAAWAVVVLMLVGMYASSTIGPLNDKIDSLAEDIKTHEQKEGHAQMQVKTSLLEGKVELLRTAIELKTEVIRTEHQATKSRVDWNEYERRQLNKESGNADGD